MEVPANYVSMFRIDGKPILPPLMTMEKRLEMQMYREKAAQLERKVLTKRVQFNDLSAVGLPSTPPRSPLDIHFDSVSQISSDVALQSESEPDAFSDGTKEKILINTACNTERQLSQERGTNTSKIVGELTLDERVSMLQKSGPIGFDLVASTVITSLPSAEKAAAAAQKERSESKRNNNVEEALRELVEKMQVKRSQSKKSLNLSLTIPSICVNPPTPIADGRKIPEVLSGTESVDSFSASGFQNSSQASHYQVTQIAEDSTDESCCTKSTEHEAFALLSQKKINNITSKILQYEQQAAADVEDEQQQFAASRPPKRSLTSPSLKSLAFEKPIDSLVSTPRTADTTTSASSLVRSSSFTLDVPSKALIDHLQQQYAADVHMSKSATTYMPTSSAGGSKNKNFQGKTLPNAWRDTVESKAKRVQKKLDFKPSSRQNSSTRSKANKNTFNVYPNSTAQLWNNPLPPAKPKKSPYDFRVPTTNRHTPKSANSKSNSGNKHQTPTLGKGHGSKKCTTYAIHHPNPQQQHKQLESQQVRMPQRSTAQHDAGGEIESNCIQKLNELIAQQRDEERRMQQMFDAQRQMLLTQLSNEKYQGHIIDNGDQSSTVLNIAGFSLNSASANSTLAGAANSVPSSVCNGNYFMATTGGSSERSSPYFNITTNTSSHVPLGGQLPESSLGVGTTATLTASDNLHSPHSERSQRPTKTYRMPVEKISHHNCGIPTQTTSNYNNNTCDSNNRASKLDLNQVKNTQERQNAAATIINAYTRGFLVRRLFQTEQIQRIVQTIKDTLIFVLNLHMETMEDPLEANTEANIKLKARLLQQLASASRTLHLIFFQTSIKERMEIIMRDRKRIKTKLLSMSLKRSPRIA